MDPAATAVSAEEAIAKPATPSPDPRPPEKAKPYPFRFQLHKGEEFTLDHMLRKGYVQAGIEISKGFIVVIRTMSVDQIQAVEALANPKEDSKTLKYIMNQLTIGQIYFSVMAINGAGANPMPPDPAERMTEKDQRWKWVKALAGPAFDQLTAAMVEFDVHAKALVSAENIRNF